MKKRKLLKLFTILLLILGTGFNIQANSKVKDEINTQLINNVTIQRLDGTQIGDGDTIGLYEDFKIVYEFSFENNHTIKEGDTLKVKVPKNLKPSKSLDFSIKDDVTAEVIGNLVFDSTTGYATLTFSEFVEEFSNVSGKFELITRWDLDVVKEDTVTPIEINYENSKTIIKPSTGVVQPVDPDELGYKYGWIVDKDNPSIIEWRVRINLAEKNIDNALIEDTVGSDHELVEGSLKAKYVKFNDETGDVLSELGAVDQNAISLRKDGFTIKLPNLNQSILLQYQTKISDDTANTEFGNTITLTGDNIETVEEISVQEISEGSGDGTGKLGSVQITKLDSETKTALAGAHYDLYYGSTLYIKDIIVDENGSAIIADLKIGDYKFIETVAPNGYYLDETPITFKITEEGEGELVEVQQLDIKIPDKPTPPEPEKPTPPEPDKPTPPEPEKPTLPEPEKPIQTEPIKPISPNTGVQSNSVLPMVILGSAAIIIIVVVIKKKKK